jgi:hypothetical protein
MTGVQEQPSPGPSGNNSNHPQPGTSEDSETTSTTGTMQDIGNECTLSNSNCGTMLQQLPEQQHSEETSHPSCSMADVA